MNTKKTGKCTNIFRLRNHLNAGGSVIIQKYRQKDFLT